MKSSYLARKIGTGAAVAVAILGVTAGATAAPRATAAHQKVSTVTISLGRVLSDPTGRVLYLFEKDTPNVSHCNSACQLYWPPLKSKGTPVAGAHVAQRHLGLTKTGQVTYYGHPLYYFVGDSKPKQDHGQASNGSGGKWYVVGTNGRAIDNT